MSGPCVSFETELSAFLDGELADVDRARVEAHLRTCAACAAEVRALQRVGNVLRRWDAHETRYAPSNGFRNRVLSRLGLPSEGVDAPATRHVLRPAVVGGLAAAAALLAAVGTWAVTRTPEIGNGAAIAALERDVAQVRDDVRRLAERGGVAAPAAGGQDRLAIPHVETPASVVAPPVEDAADTAAEAQPPEVWEVREDGTLLRDVRSNYEEFLSDQSRLYFQERVSELTRPRTDGTKVTRADPAPSPISTLLGQAAVSDVAFPQFEHVQVWPIELTPAPRGSARPMNAEEAISRKALAVREDSDGAVVATNSDPRGRSVLLLAGDVLAGARRDRIVREEMVVPAGREVVVPTYGSGALRERTRYRNFTHSGLVAPLDVRALVAASHLGEPVAQGEVDEAVRAAVTAMGANNGSGSLDNLGIYTNVELQRELARTADAFRARLDRPQVIGFAVAVGPNLVAVELCGDVETFRAIRDRALRSHLLYAILRPEQEKAGPAPEASEVTALLGAARRSVFSDPPASAEATLRAFRTADAGVYGNGLVAGNRVIHAVVFAGTPGDAGTSTVGGGRRGLGRSGGAFDGGGPAPAGSGPARGGDGSRGVDDR